MDNLCKERIHKERKRNKLSGSDETGKMYFICLRQNCSAKADNKLGEKKVTWRKTGP